MISRLARALVQLLVGLVATSKRAVYDPIANWWVSWAELWVSTSEESTKSVIRESFAVLVRVINGASAWFVSLFFDRSYYARLRRNLTRPNPWSTWWDDCNSTFNALIERDYSTTNGQPQPQPRRQGAQSSTQQAFSSQLAPQPQTVSRTTSPPRKARRRPTPPPITGVKRNASDDLFQAQAGWAAAEGDSRSGVLEDLKLQSELLVDACFGVLRGALALLRRLLLLQPSKAGGRAQRRSTRRRPLEDWGTADVIRAAGYPVELHDVHTPDGYKLQLIRMPHPDARDAVFFLHGIFDTALGWVANGVTGSQAFAAYDAGLDVWLGTSRSNPPRSHVDPACRGGRYFYYSVNELAMFDVGAQVDAIDACKRRELFAAQLRGAVLALTPEAGPPPPPLDSKLEGGDVTQEASYASPFSSKRADVGGTSPHGWRVGSASTAAVNHSNGGAVSHPLPDVLDEWHSPAGSPGATTPAPQPGREHAKASTSSSPDSWHECELSSGGDPSGGWRLPPGLRPTVVLPVAASEAADVMVPDLYALHGRHLDPEQEAAPISTAASAHLDRVQPELAGTPVEPPQRGPPYRLRAVGHSLGGAMLLMYAVRRRMEGRPHHLCRLVLLTPAGMLREFPLLAVPFLLVLPVVVRVLALLWPGRGGAVNLPFWWLRTIAFKLAVDLQHMPGLQQLVVAIIRWVLSQDPSEWDAAMRMPHYNAGGMPVLALHVGHHMCQWVRARAFRMYDYGSAAANRARYGSPTPPDIGARYNMLDVPVDLLAGRADGIVSSANVLLHFDAMRDAGTRVTFKEFNFGHLDFTFAVKEELRHYVLSRLLLKVN